MASLRAPRLSARLVDDLNGDFAITREELRLTALREASAPLRANGMEVAPTREQIEVIAEQIIARKMQDDADGDGVISQAELLSAVTAQINPANLRSNVFPVLQTHDRNGDGLVTEEEFLTTLRAFYRAADTDGDGTLSGREVAALMRSKPELIELGPIDLTPSPRRENGDAGTFGRARAACKMPAVAQGNEVIVVGGYEGAALTDLWFASPDTVAELLDLKLPASGAPVTMIAPFYGPTVIRLDDPGARVRQVITTQAPVGLIGAGDGVAFTQTDSACHISMFDEISPENPEPSAFYARLLDRPVDRVLKGYTLATANAENGAVTSDTRLDGAASPEAAVTDTEAWQHFERFNPGGLVPVDPATVQASVEVGRHEIWPQQAGIARLVADGALVPLPRQDIKRIILENDAGEIRIRDKTFVPGSGDDLISMGGLLYTEEREKTWVGRRPLIYLATRKVSLPAGLAGAHSVQIAVPQGTPVPDRLSSGVKLHMIDDANRLTKTKP